MPNLDCVVQQVANLHEVLLVIRRFSDVFCFMIILVYKFAGILEVQYDQPFLIATALFLFLDHRISCFSTERRSSRTQEHCKVQTPNKRKNKTEESNMCTGKESLTL